MHIPTTTTTSIISHPSYTQTCISWHLQLRTGRFSWCKVLLPACPCWRQPLSTLSCFVLSHGLCTFLMHISYTSPHVHMYVCMYSTHAWTDGQTTRKIMPPASSVGWVWHKNCSLRWHSLRKYDTIIMQFGTSPLLCVATGFMQSLQNNYL